MDIWKKLPVIGPRLVREEAERDSLRARNEIQRVKLHDIHTLYERRCEATVNDFTEDEELFLSNISIALYGQDIQKIQTNVKVKRTYNDWIQLINKGKRRKERVRA